MMAWAGASRVCVAGHWSSALQASRSILKRRISWGAGVLVLGEDLLPAVHGNEDGTAFAGAGLVLINPPAAGNLSKDMEFVGDVPPHPPGRTLFFRGYGPKEIFKIAEPAGTVEVL